MTLRLFVLSPTVVYQAQVNQTDFTYPLDQVGYDNPVGYNLAHVQVGQTVVFGTTPGGDDLGRQRIRKLPILDAMAT